MKSIASVSLFAAWYGARSAAADPIPAVLVDRLNPLTYEGCYSSSVGLEFNTSWMYNSKGYCQQQCAPAGKSVQATTNKTDCWCGDNLPPSSAKVADSYCNDPCAGFGSEMCGSAGSTYFSVYLTGSGTVSSSSAGTTTSSTSAPTASATTSAKPSVVTVGGAPVTVTASSSARPSASSKSSGPNKAGIAAGIVVGVVAIAAIAGGIFLYVRSQRRREVEEEYKRNAAAASFVAGGQVPSSSAGSSSFIDTRLDPVMAQRRMSDGSIADNQDYSRRILKVTNA